MRPANAEDVYAVHESGYWREIWLYDLGKMRDGETWDHKTRYRLLIFRCECLSLQNDTKIGLMVLDSKR